MKIAQGECKILSLSNIMYYAKPQPILYKDSAR